jgi:hypothetical protein
MRPGEAAVAVVIGALLASFRSRPHLRDPLCSRAGEARRCRPVSRSAVDARRKGNMHGQMDRHRGHGRGLHRDLLRVLLSELGPRDLPSDRDGHRGGGGGRTGRRTARSLPPLGRRPPRVGDGPTGLDHRGGLRNRPRPARAPRTPGVDRTHAPPYPGARGAGSAAAVATCRPWSGNTGRRLAITIGQSRRPVALEFHGQAARFSGSAGGTECAVGTHG